MSAFPELERSLRELKVACRQVACANLRMEMMLDDLAALGPEPKDDELRAVLDKYERKP